MVREHIRNREQEDLRLDQPGCGDNPATYRVPQPCGLRWGPQPSALNGSHRKAPALLMEYLLQLLKVMPPPTLRKLNYLRAMGWRHALFRARSLFSPPASRFACQVDKLRGTGLEIGGPSDIFRAGSVLPAYAVARRIDNVTFSRKTRWEGVVEPEANFIFDASKPPGTQYLLEARGLWPLASESYDFVLSSHMLEHTANPIGALREWSRVLKAGGKPLLVLPHRDGSFDHRRPVTSITHWLDGYANARGENDMTHFAEILALHDLRRDPLQTSTALLQTASDLYRLSPFRSDHHAI